MKPIQLLILMTMLMSTLATHTRDMYHFYRTPNFFHTTHIAKPYLTTFDTSMAFGSSSTSRTTNCALVGHYCDAQSSLFNVYGLHNMRVLGAQVPDLDPTNPLDALLINLSTLPERSHFGYLRFKGNLELAEYHFTLTHNFCHGFFVEFDLPIRQLTTSHIEYIDESPRDHQFPSATTPEWQLFLENFHAILKQRQRSINNSYEAGTGDCSLAAGWALNYDATKKIDFIDLTLKFGTLQPSSKKTSITNPFALPLGYNGHSGIFISADAALGYFDWLTLGGHISSYWFNNKKREIALKTNSAQNGFIKLAYACTNVQLGSILHTSAYLQADHFFKGLSLLCGYSYTYQNTTELSVFDNPSFNDALINSDEHLKSWSMKTIHCIIAYDLPTDSRSLYPRIGAFYNLQVGGKRVINLSTGGGTCGIDLLWKL